MSSSSAAPVGESATIGAFNYLDKSVNHSLRRNAKVLTRRDRDGSDAGTEGVSLVEHKMAVRNARQQTATARPTIVTNGFELVTRPLADSNLNFLEHSQVVQHYYNECAQLVRETTDATQVFAFDHNIRSASGEKNKQRIAGGQQVQGPAHLVHGDYTLTSAPQRLRELAKPPSANDTLRAILPAGDTLLNTASVREALEESGRFAIINVWRSFADEPVATHPLALCDAQSVQPQHLVVFEIHYQDRIGENYFAKYSPEHCWYYYPEMTRDEALLIKQWDSAGELATSNGARGDASGGRNASTFSFHSAFEDPSTPPNAPERWSIEVRCIVLYE
jgi:hypothetical protein